MTQEEPAKRKVRADPHRVMTWLDSGLAQRRPVRVLATGVLLLGLALLLGPRLWSGESLTARYKRGMRAEGNIKAARTFTYFVSDEKLKQEQQEAVSKVLPVLDHQSDLGTLLVSRIGKAFARMTPADAGAPPPGPGSPAAQTKGPARAASPAEPGPDAEEQRRAFEEALQIELVPQELKALRKAKFSAEARSSLQVMVASAMSQLVVTPDVLGEFKNKPVQVRHLVAGRLSREGEEKLGSAPLKDVQQVREETRLQASVHTAKLPPDVAKAVEGLALRLINANTIHNRAETEARRVAARQAIGTRTIPVVKGQVIVNDGEPITQEHELMLRAMADEERARGNLVQGIVGIGLFVFIICAVVYRVARQQFTRFVRQPRDLVVMGALVLGFVALAKGVVAIGGSAVRGDEVRAFAYVMPLAAGAMLVRLLITAEAAALFSVVLAPLCGLLLERNLGVALFYLATSLVGSAGVAQVQSRSTILRAGLGAGLIGAALVAGLRLFQGHFADFDSVYAMLAAAAGGVLAAFLTLALLPAMEWLFAYTTDVTLLELANLNHPLLRDLILRAPGTYHHSMVVGNLSEAACEAIGANGLLARVASYYHDIGKVRNAVYFAENFKPGDNPHNRLKPSMSALIIRSHVKDTVEMLDEHGVPEQVIETATQHHGQTLIEFFFHKAVEQKEGGGEEVHEEEYRYPGPKPQSREAGVIMLADAVEAAARSLPDPTEDRLTGVVQRVINTKFTDGQLDHCDLTLRDLHLIAKSFLQVLRGIYHQRPTYPWQQRRDETKRETGRMKAIDRETEEEAESKARGEATPPKDGKKKTDPTAKDAKDGQKRKPETRVEKKAEPRPDNGGQSKGEGKRAKRETSEHAAVALKPESTGAGAEPARPKGPDEPPAESGPDLKRLGLD